MPEARSALVVGVPSAVSPSKRVSSVWHAYEAWLSAGVIPRRPWRVPALAPYGTIRDSLVSRCPHVAHTSGIAPFVVVPRAVNRWPTKVTRKNLRLRLGDIATVHQAPDVKYATVVHVLPYAEDLEGVTGETFETFLQPFFEGEFKPVSQPWEVTIVSRGFIFVAAADGKVYRVIVSSSWCVR